MNPSNLSILVVCALSGAGCMPEIKGITRSPAADPGPGAVGALNDGTWNVSLSRSPRISWAAPASFGSNGLGHYDYSIGSAAGLTDLLAWTSAGTASSTYATGLSLVDATDYFVNVRVVDAVGRFSAVTSSNGWRTRVTGAGAFAAAANQAANAAPRAVAVGDFNRDGKLDFVCANGGTGTTLSLYLGDGLGGFARQADLTVIQNPQGLVVADFDKDGFLDIAVISYFPGDLQLFRGNGDGTFAARQDLSLGNTATGITAVDVDHDGFLDLVITQNAANAAIVVKNTGLATVFTLAGTSSSTTAAAPKSVVTGDFDGDGWADFATANETANSVSIISGNSNGTLGVAANRAAGTFPRVIAVGDFNLDGKPDVATPNQTSNSISVFLNSSSGVGNYGFAAPVNYAVPGGSSPHGLWVADVNGDGVPDLIATYSASTTIGVLLGKGDGTFEAPVTFTVGTSPYRLVSGDFNNDGKIDLVIANKDSNNVSVLLGQ